MLGWLHPPLLRVVFSLSLIQSFSFTGTIQASETPRFPSEDKKKSPSASCDPGRSGPRSPLLHHILSLKECVWVWERIMWLNWSLPIFAKRVNELPVRVMIDQAVALESSLSDSSLCWSENVSFKLNDDDGPKIKAKWVFKRNVWFCWSQCSWALNLLSVTRCRHRSADPVGAVVTPADHSMVIQDIPGCSRQVKSTLIQRLFLALDQVGAVISVMVLIQIRINRSAVSQCRSTTDPEQLMSLETIFVIYFLLWY